jgi:hypothetical protein
MDGRDARLKPGSFAAVLLAQHFMDAEFTSEPWSGCPCRLLYRPLCDRFPSLSAPGDFSAALRPIPLADEIAFGKAVASCGGPSTSRRSTLEFAGRFACGASLGMTVV